MTNPEKEQSVITEVARERSGVIYRRLLGYLRPHLAVFVFSMLGFVAYSLTQPALAAVIEYIVETLEGLHPRARQILPFVLIGIVTVRGIGSFIGNYGLIYVARHIIHALRQDIFARFMVLPARFFGKNSSSRLVSMVTYNVEQVAGAATEAVRVLIREGFTALGLLCYMIYLNWKLSLIFLCLGPVVFWFISTAGRRMRKISYDVQDSMGTITSVVSESIRNHQMVKIYQGEKNERGRFDQASQTNRQQAMKVALVSTINTPVVQMLIAFATALLIYLGLHPDTLGAMSAGQFVAFLTAAGMLIKPIRALTELNNFIQPGIAAADSLFNLIDEEEEQDCGTNKVGAQRVGLEFRGVGFAYPDHEGEKSETVLEGINLSIGANESIALVGRSGSGKSTLVSLIPRFFEPDEGEILLGDQPLRDYRLNSLRKQVAYVGQHITLYEGTIGENIAFGGLAKASAEAIDDAAKRAHVLDFTQGMERGLDTVVGENGLRLSGGQRQRIAIARAILKNAPILILDEATSSLDSESERYVQEAMRAVMVDRMTIVIAHRLSTIESVDRIVVLDQGRIIEEGSHQSLLGAKGHYARLYKLQFAS